MIKYLLTILIATSVSAEVVEIYNPKADDFQPAEFQCASEQGRPALMFLHSWSAEYTQARALKLHTLASDLNWSLMAPNFRGPSIRDKRVNFPLGLIDIKQAREHLVENCNPSKVYLYGASGGGWMSLIVAQKYPNFWDRIAVAVPITNLNKWRTSLIKKNNFDTGRIVPGLTSLCTVRGKFSKRLCNKRSPIPREKQIDVPVKLIHGINDNLVSPMQSIEYFKKVKGEVYLDIPAGGHDFFIDEAIEFLRSE